MRWNAAVAGLAASWGLIAIIVAGVDLDAVVLVFLRLALAAASIGLAALLLRRGTLLRLPTAPHRLLLLGAVLAAHWFLFFEAIKLASVAVALLLVYTAPLFLALLAPWFLPERHSRVAFAALVPAGAGLATIALAGGEEVGASPLAVAAGLGAALSYAGLVIATKRVVATVHSATVTFWTYASAGVLLAPFLLAAGRVVPRGLEIAYALLLGVVFTALSGFLYVSLLRRVTAQAVGVLAYVEPVSAAALAWAVLGQPLEAPVVAGGLLVVAAGVLVIVREPADPVPIEAAPVPPR
ncbi:MAG: DMT family transporter [Thermoleophilia bacterium]|nr:DMT family transporter [Thermoleophilia bacterium]